jgi:hypothetical protein
MKTRKTLLLITFLIIFLISSVGAILAQSDNPPEEDYRYQLDQYRRHYSEYQIFKSDYFDNSTLDNEQKTILSARSAIVARELTQSSYVRWLNQNLDATQTEGLSTTIVRSQLKELFDFYSQQADLARSIQTKKDLTAFTTSYIAFLNKDQAYWNRAQIIIKVARLRKLQRNADAAFAVILPQIEGKKDVPLVKNGIQEVYDLQIEINGLLEKATSTAISLKEEKKEGNQVLKDITKIFSQAQTLQIRIINRIIDLDENYVDR